MKASRLTILAAIVLLATAGLARAADEHEQHHPNAAAPQGSTQAPAPAPSPQTAGGDARMPGNRGGQDMGMMGSMSGASGGMMGQDMGSMMQMMRMMGMMGAGRSMDATMGGMAGRMMTDHVEGRIAFLRAELKITNAQANEWNPFADAMRSNAQKLAAAHGQASQPGSSPATVVERMALEQRRLAARAEGAQAITSTLDKLYAALSDEQKKLADELLPPHLGLMPMGRM